MIYERRREYMREDLMQIVKPGQDSARERNFGRSLV